MRRAPLVSSLAACFFAAAAVAATVTATPALASAKDAEASESLSQLIRSNTGHYWSYVKGALPDYASYEGLVAGDPHMGNFSVIPVTTKSGRRQLKFVDIDFDDAGRGPFSLDFVRLVVTVKAVDKDVKIKDLVQAYVDGLQGRSAKVPSRIADVLSMSLARYDSLDADYVDKKTSHGKFKLKAGELERYAGTYRLDQIQALFPGVKVLDLASRPAERGGSAAAVRIWVLTESPDGVQRISEIKGYRPTALSEYESQKDPGALVRDIQAVFWPGLDPSGYDLTGLEGDLVWVRPKKIPLIDIPYKLKSADDQVFVSDLALYDANILGRIHGAQSAAYVRAVTASQDDFRLAVKQLSHDYLDNVKQTLR
jgi:hypothetical protein